MICTQNQIQSEYIGNGLVVHMLNASPIFYRTDTERVREETYRLKYRNTEPHYDMLARFYIAESTKDKFDSNNVPAGNRLLACNTTVVPLEGEDDLPTGISTTVAQAFFIDKVDGKDKTYNLFNYDHETPILTGFKLRTSGTCKLGCFQGQCNDQIAPTGKNTTTKDIEYTWENSREIK